MIANLSIKTKLFFVFICTTLFAICVIGITSFYSARNQLRTVTFKQLTAAREAQKGVIEKYFRDIRFQCLTISESTMTTQAMHALKKAFNTIPIDEFIFKKHKKELLTFYEKEFLPKVNETSTVTKNIDDFFPKDEKTILLQSLYLAQNPNPIIKKREYSKAPDGSEYSDLHELYHGIFYKYLKRFGFLDIYLVDIDSGHVVFNISKEIDFATNLLTGPLKDTSLAKTFKEIQKTTDENFVKLQDFAFYDPSYGIPTSFIGTPIYEKGQKIGGLIFQLPIDIINTIMTYNKRWQDVGLGETGETFIVGYDKYMRTLARSFIENKRGYLQKLRTLNIKTEVIDRMKIYNTTILLQEINNAATRRISRGITDIQEMKNGYIKDNSLTAYAPLKIEDVQWGIIATISMTEALAPINKTAWRIILWACIILLLIIIFAWIFLYFFNKPIKNILKVLSRPDLNLTMKLPVYSQDEIGTIAQGYNSLIEKTAEVIHGVKTIKGELINTIELFIQTNETLKNNTLSLLRITQTNTDQSLIMNNALKDILEYNQTLKTKMDTFSHHIIQAKKTTHLIEKGSSILISKTENAQQTARNTQQQSATIRDITQTITIHMTALKKEFDSIYTTLSDNQYKNSDLHTNVTTTYTSLNQCLEVYNKLQQSIAPTLQESQKTYDTITNLIHEITNNTHHVTTLVKEYEHITYTEKEIQNISAKTTDLHKQMADATQNIANNSTEINTIAHETQQATETLIGIQKQCITIKKRFRDILERRHF